MTEVNDNIVKPQIMSPDKRFEKMAEIYRTRNAVYGDTYKRFGAVMKSLFPMPVTLDTEEDWNRMAIYFHMCDKMARYAAAFAKGGHVDSLDDTSIYAMLLQTYDAEAQLKEQGK